MTTDARLFAGRYEILETVAGGTSIVRKARDPHVGRYVAIKTPSDVVVATPAMYARFVEEARTLGRLDHPGVLRILHFYDKGEVDDRCHLVSNWMDESLATVAERSDVDWRSKLAVMRRVLDAVAYLHAQGIVHRDLKPANVLVSHDLRDVRVADLGIARASGATSHTANATFRYVAPEALKVDAPSVPQLDVYSLGITFFEVFAGRERFERSFEEIFRDGGGGEGDVRWLNWHLDSSRRLPDLHEIDREIPGVLAAVIARMAEKDTALRFRDIAEVKAALSPLGGANADDSLEALDPEDFEARRRESEGKGDGRKDGKGRRGKPLSKGAVVALSVVGFLVLAIGILVVPEILGGSEEPPATGSPEFARLEAVVKQAEALGVAPDVEPYAQARQQVAAGPGDTAAATFAAAAAALEAALPGAPRMAALGTSPEQLAAVLAECARDGGGCEREEFSDERARAIRLAPFDLDRTEVSVADFEAFVRATGHVTSPETKGFVARLDGTRTSVKVPKASWRTLAAESAGDSSAALPVRGVSYVDARAYCTWKGARLPTEDEWEYAAQSPRGGASAWSPTLVPARDAAASGRFALLGLEANVWEWVEPTLDTQGPGVLKGGSWLEREPARRRPAARRLQERDSAHTDDGFRCARDAARWPDAAGSPAATAPAAAAPAPAAPSAVEAR